MGTCFSSATSTTNPPSTAKVVDASGNLFEFSSAMKSSLLLDSSSRSFFICNSDRLLCDERIPALGPEELLLPGQLYFVLPAQKLKAPLSGRDMATLAVRASSALSKSREGGRRSGKIAKVMPSSVACTKVHMGKEEIMSSRKKETKNRGCGAVRVKVSPASGRSNLETIEEVEEQG